MEGWIDGCRCDDVDDDDDLVQSVSQSVGWSKKSNVHMTKILMTTRGWLADLNDETTTDE